MRGFNRAGVSVETALLSVSTLPKIRPQEFPAKDIK
jgi:hypothetical protein